MNKPPEIGILLSGEGMSLADVVDFGVAAEDAGLDSVWHVEIFREPIVPLAAIAARTSRIRLGTGVRIWARSPILASLAGSNMAELSNGRFVYGLGTGPPDWNRRFHGMSYERPVERIREYVQVMRGAWTAAHDGTTLDHHGEHYQIEGYANPISDVQARVPIFLAAVRERMCQLAGEVGDGILFNFFTTPKYLSDFALPNVERGAARSGRRADEIELASIVTTAVSNDASQARQWARYHLAFYSVLPYFDVMFELHGFETETAAIRNAASRDDGAAMIAAVTEEMIDTFAIAGSPEQVRKQVEDWSDLDLLVLTPPTFNLSDEEIAANHRTILETFSR